MTRTLKYILYTTIILSSLSLALTTSVNAAEQGVTVTPAFVEYNVKPGSDKSQEVSLTNDSDEVIGVTIQGVKLSNGNQGLEIKDNNTDFKFNTNTLLVEPHQTDKFNVEINLEEKILEDSYTPAISLIVNRPGKQTVGINQNILIPVRMTFTNEVKYDLNISLLTVPASTIFSQNFQIVGAVVNKQNRYFQPAGKVEITQDKTLIQSWPLTDALPEKLDPQQVISFTLPVSGLNLKPFTSYNVNLFITDVATKQSIATTYKVYYFPLELLFLAIVFVVILIVGFVAAFIQRRKHRLSTKQPKRK
jgi:hypothetical protein